MQLDDACLSSQYIFTSTGEEAEKCVSPSYVPKYTADKNRTLLVIILRAGEHRPHQMQELR